MNPSDKMVVLDASALLAYLHNEPGGEKVYKVLNSAAMSIVNLTEVLTVSLSVWGEDPQFLCQKLLALEIHICELSLEDSIMIAALRPKTRIQGLSLGDRACLALGMRLNAKVFTAEKQKDWRKLNLQGVKIELIR